LAAYGLPLDAGLVGRGNFSRSASCDAMHELLNRRDDAFEAVVAANDEMAIGALEALEARGRRVPDQVAVAGFDDTKDAQLVTPSLTTVRQPLYEQGRQAAAMLLALLRGEPVPGQVVLPTRLQVRRSCGCLTQTVMPMVPAGSPSRKDVHRDLVAGRERAPAGIAHADNTSEEGPQFLDMF